MDEARKCDGCGQEMRRPGLRPVPRLSREHVRQDGGSSYTMNFGGDYCNHECFWLHVVSIPGDPDARMMALTRLVSAATRELERERLQRTWWGRLWLWWTDRSHDRVLNQW